MKIRIHRGTKQIGGCITEIQSERGTRILIDLGHNLPGENDTADEYDDSSRLAALLDGVSAVVYTHNHGDHVGFFYKVPEGIPQYIGEMAKEVMFNIVDDTINRLSRTERKSYIDEYFEKIDALRAFRTYKTAKTFYVDDIAVTPFFNFANA